MQEYTRKLKKLRNFFIKKIIFFIFLKLVFGLTWLFLLLSKCLCGPLNVNNLILYIFLPYVC